MQKIIDDFYIISELLDDDYELIIDFIKDKTSTIKTKSIIKRCVESASYHLLAEEIDFCLNIKLNTYKVYKRNWYALHQNETLFDDIN